MSEWILTKGDFSEHPALDFERIMRRCRKDGIRRLVVPKDTYLIEADFCAQAYMTVSNHGHNGPKRVAFLIEDMEDFEIDFSGSLLMCSGILTPFALLRSRNIRIKGVRLDSDFTQMLEARVVAHNEDGSVDVEPIRGMEGFIILRGLLFCNRAVYPRDLQPLHLQVEYRPDTGEIEYGTGDNTFNRKPLEIQFEQLDNGNLRCLNPNRLPPIGNVMVFMGSRRVGSGFFLEECDGVVLSDIVVYACYGMAFIAQMSKNLTLSDFHTKRAEGRYLSANADATHFVNCSGDILVENCSFEGQLDDALNIHGMYTRVLEVKGREVLLRQMHIEAMGIRIFHKGDRVRALPTDTLIPYEEHTVEEVEYINDRICRLILDTPAEHIAVGDDIENISASANLIFRNNRVQNNRARGMLIANIGTSLIENCYFHTSGSSVKLECDGEYWFESGGVGELIIRGCHFDRCLHGKWGKAVIEAQKRKAVLEDSYFHRRVVIENNTFTLFADGVAQINNTEEFVFANNKIISAESANAHVKADHIRSLTVQPDVVLNPEE
ncbi:MAG: right-handed parallel beta-helix repeat-containing protein [Clostridia bacterium]|nr:right-handed parallel beta-helix repeat-containing protein [Clostridia bacterium]